MKEIILDWFALTTITADFGFSYFRNSETLVRKTREIKNCGFTNFLAQIFEFASITFQRDVVLAVFKL
jgi:hypothetical protein